MNDKPNSNKSNLVNNCKKVVNILNNKFPKIIEIAVFSVVGFIVSLPITIPYFLESQVQPKISLEPVITIQNPNEPHISLNKSVIKIPQSK